MKVFKWLVIVGVLVVALPGLAGAWAEPMTAVMKDTQGVTSGVTVLVISEGGTGVTVFKVLAGGAAEFPTGVSVLTTPGSHNYAVNLTKVLSEIVAGVSPLYNDSMVDAYHRHSELSASDGDPNAVLYVKATGDIVIGTADTIEVGCGVSTPARQFHVKDTILLSNDAIGYAGAGGILSFSGSSTFYLYNFQKEGKISFDIITSDVYKYALRLIPEGAVFGHNATSGVSMPGGGVTNFVAVGNSGVTPSALTGGAGLFAYNDELYAMDAAGNVTRLSAHDKDTGESVHYSFNIYTGVGKTIWLEQGNRTDTFTVQRVNPEECAKSAWISRWMEDNTVKIKDARGEYRIIVSPTLEQAQAEASKKFTFKWNTLPKFVRQAWGK